MKNVLSYALCVILVIITTHANSQIQNKLPLTEPDYNKPKLFNNLPSVLPLNIGQINAALNKEEGSEVNIQLADQLNIQGVIISASEKKNGHLKSIVVKCSNWPGTYLTLSSNDKNSDLNINGRLLSRQYGDAFEVEKKNGNYYLQKINLYDLLSE
jgi:hypothetical protein